MANKAVQPQSNVESLRVQIEQMRDQFALSLPPGVSPERFARFVMSAVQSNPRLAECDRRSFFSACMKAAKDGLIPDGKQACIVPRNDKKSGLLLAVYQQMVSGVLILMYRSGLIQSISTALVYNDEQYKRWTDENGDHLNHVHSDSHGSSRSDDVRCAYAIVRLKEGGIYIESMSLEQIDAVASKSQQQSSLKWGDFWTEGAKVSVLKRIAKRLPIDVDLTDDDFEKEAAPATVGQAVASLPVAANVKQISGKHTEKIEATPAPQERAKSSRLSKAIAPPSEPVQQEAPEISEQEADPLEAEIEEGEL